MVTIGVDIDDVIADFIPTLVLFHNDLYGSNLTKNHFVSYDFWKVWGGTKEEAVFKVNEMLTNPTYFRKIPPLDNSIPSLRKLKDEGAILHAITGRRNSALNSTMEWINTYFPDFFTSIHFTNSYCLEGKSEKKSKICKDLGVTVIIEDHITHALDCAENDIRVLLFDCPWNKNTPVHEKIERVFSWNEVIEKV